MRGRMNGKSKAQISLQDVEIWFADALGIGKTSAGDYLEEQGADFYDGS